MKRTIRFLLAALWVWLPVGFVGASSDARTYRVDLSGSPNLAAFFEAGLVPRRENSSSTYRCHLTAVSIEFVIAGEVLPEVDFDDLGILLFREGEIRKISGAVGSLPLAEAERLGVEFCAALGLDDEVITSFADGIREGKEVPRTGAGFQHRFDGGSITFGLGQPPSWDQIHVVGFGVTITFPREDADYSLPDQILRPPPGYEHLSMEPYSLDEQAENRRIYGERLGRRTRVAMGLDEDEDGGNGAEVDAGAAPDAGSAQPMHSRAPVNNPGVGDHEAPGDPDGRRSSWRWIVAAFGIIGALVLILVAIARSRGRVGPRN